MNIEKNLIPGNKHGISSSYIRGNNISINKYIEEKIIPSKTAIVHLTSTEFQKYLEIKYEMYPDVCVVLDCDLY